MIENGSNAMNVLIDVRDKIKNFISENESWCIRGLNFVMLLFGALFLNANLGYASQIDKWWVAVLVSVVCAFLPTSGGVFVLVAMTEVHLFALSTEMAIAGAVIFLAAYLLCAYFKSKDTCNLAVIPTAYCMHMPFISPMVAGLLRNINDLSSVLAGTIVSYFLYSVKSNASAILDETSEVTAISLLTNQMFKSKMFYFYAIAMVSMFLLVYLIRQADIKMAWLVAIGSGILAEFLIMLTGMIVSGESSKIIWLVIGNIIAAAVGVVLTWFFFNLDYTRVEKMQFEDDDYHYYVVAVPKVRIASEDKKIKRI